MDRTSLKEAVDSRKNLEAQIETAKNIIKSYQEEAQRLEGLLCDYTVREAYIKEIYRLAEYQFPRLRRTPGSELTNADVAEIEKWVKRAKTLSALLSVVEAFKEISKYNPIDIRRNLYALVQSIISGGAYKEKRK